MGDDTTILAYLRRIEQRDFEILKEIEELQGQEFEKLKPHFEAMERSSHEISKEIDEIRRKLLNEN